MEQSSGKCITRDQLKTVVAAAMSALAEEDIVIKDKETDVEVHPHEAAQASSTQWPDADPRDWTDEQRDQALAAYMAENPEDNE